MYLVVNKVGKFQVIHVTYGYPAVKRLTGTAVIQDCLSVLGQSCLFQSFNNIYLGCTVKYRRSNLPAQCLCCIAQVHFQYLSDIHTGRNAQGIKNNLQGSSVGQERHIFHRENPGDNTLVSVTAGHLIADRNLSFLCNVNTHQLVYSGREFVAHFTGEYLYVNNNTRFPVRNSQGCIPYLPRFFTEDRTKQPFFRGKLGFSLRSNLTDKYVSCTYLGTNTDNSAFIKILQRIFAYVRNIPGYLFRTQLGVAGFRLVLFYMD